MTAAAELKGDWTGKIETWKRELPFTMRVLETGDVHVRLADQMMMLINEPRWENDYFSGEFIADLGTEDTGPGPSQIRLLLSKRGEVLNGSATASAVPGMRGGYNLTHWTELHRTSR